MKIQLATPTLCLLCLPLAACVGEVGGEENGNVEIHSAADQARDSFNVGLVAEDDESEAAGAALEGSSVASSNGWIAETSSGSSRLALVQELAVQPFADLALGDSLLVATTATSRTNLDGLELQVVVTSPSGVSETLIEGVSALEAGAMADIYQDSQPLTETGIYTVRTRLLSADKVVAEEREAKVNVVATRQIMSGALATIMRQAARFRYSRGSCSNRTCLVKKGRGDCWAMSDWIWYKLERAGINARIIQYRTSGSSRHRTVQYYSGGWKDVPYRAYGVSRNFRTTAKRPGLFVYRN